MDTHDISGIPEYIRLLEEQKTLLHDAISRKGQRPTDQRTRDQVIFDFMFKNNFLNSEDNEKNQTSNVFSMKSSLIPPSYAPCITPLTDLAKIKIEELRLETHNRESYIVLRSITPASTATGITAVMEDENGNVVLLQLFNQEKHRDGKGIIGGGMAVVVKEPYFKVAGDGNYLIRVDHVSDLVHLSEGNERMPINWGLRVFELDALSWKNKGNNHFRRSEYYAAIDCYSKAFESSPAEEETLALRLNRSMAFIKTKQFDHGLVDAESALALETTEKALFRMGQALYNVQRYRECSDIFKTLLRKHPANKAAKNELTRVKSRLLEQEKGTYNFKKMHEDANTLRPSHLDYATYTGPVDVREAGALGRGLFTTKEIKAGDFILCEKAFAHSFVDPMDERNSATVSSVINMETDEMTEGAQADLLSMAVQKLYANPSLNQTITKMDHGTYNPVDRAEIEGKPIVDTFLMERIISLNAFGCALSTRSDYLQYMQGLISGSPPKTDEKYYHSCGIWPTASMINHSCCSNASRSFIGDMMIVRATKDLPVNTQIFFWYAAPTGDNLEESQKRLLKHWDIKCRCVICEDYRAAKNVNRRDPLNRENLRNTAMQLLEVHVNPSEIRTVFAKLGDTYARPAIDVVPRLALWDLHLTLAQNFNSQLKFFRAVEPMMKALESLGYVIEGADFPHVPGKPLEVKRWGIMVDGVFECWMGLSKTFSLLAPELAPQAEGHAKIAYKICMGEDETFEETCALVG